MLFKELGREDLEDFKKFIYQMYNEAPSAIWFSEKPSSNELDELFYKKLQGMRERTVVDIVAREATGIVAECEIVVKENVGVVGILVHDKYRNKGLGAKLLGKGTEIAKGLGVETLLAEVFDSNTNATGFFAKNGFLVERVAEGGRKNGELLLLKKEI